MLAIKIIPIIMFRKHTHMLDFLDFYLGMLFCYSEISYGVHCCGQLPVAISEQSLWQSNAKTAMLLATQKEPLSSKN